MTTTPTTEAPNHRTLYCVKQFDCRRPECRERVRAYTRNRYRRVGYGTWQPLVDADPARQHIAALRAAGISTNVIADTAGVSRATLARIVYGQPAGRPTGKIRKESSDALLAVRAEHCRPTDGSRIDATGTRRRIQALVTAGWSFTALSEHVGIHARPLGDLARAAHVNVGTARKIEAAYRKLAERAPSDHGVHSQAQAVAKNLARRNGWRDPLWWDDMGHIDDPDFDPDTAEAELNRDELAAVRRAEVAHLAAFGCNAEEIHKRLAKEIALSTIRAILAELRSGQRRDRTGMAA